MAESVQFALVTMNIPLQSATRPSFGIDHQEEPEKTSKVGWLQQMASCSATIGNCQGVAEVHQSHRPAQMFWLWKD